GLETVAGEIVSARAISLDAYVTAFDELAASVAPEAPPREAPRAVPVAEPPPPRPGSPVTSREVPKPSSWGDVVAASSEASRPAPLTAGSPAAIPPRPVRARVEADSVAYPEEGDPVDHFAFGPCDVILSHG